MKASAKYVMRSGQIVVTGEEPESPEISIIQIAQRELEIISTRNGSRQNVEDVISMLTTRTLPPPIVETSPLEMVNQAPNLMKTGEINSRVVINNYINMLSLMLNNLN